MCVDIESLFFNLTITACCSINCKRQAASIATGPQTRPGQVRAIAMDESASDVASAKSMMIADSSTDAHCAYEATLLLGAQTEYICSKVARDQTCRSVAT